MFKHLSATYLIFGLLITSGCSNEEFVINESAKNNVMVTSSSNSIGIFDLKELVNNSDTIGFSKIIEIREPAIHGSFTYVDFVVQIDTPLKGEAGQYVVRTEAPNTVVIQNDGKQTIYVSSSPITEIDSRVGDEVIMFLGSEIGEMRSFGDLTNVKALVFGPQGLFVKNTVMDLYENSTGVDEISPPIRLTKNFENEIRDIINELELNPQKKFSEMKSDI